MNEYLPQTVQNYSISNDSMRLSQLLAQITQRTQILIAQMEAQNPPQQYQVMPVQQVPLSNTYQQNVPINYGGQVNSYGTMNFSSPAFSLSMPMNPPSQSATDFLTRCVGVGLCAGLGLGLAISISSLLKE